MMPRDSEPGLAWQSLRDALRAFVDARDWDQFHEPRNLAASVSIEAAELLELFQWRAPDWERLQAGGDLHDAAREEVADVLLYLFQICERLGLDPLSIAAAKLARNERRFPPGTNPSP